MVFIIRQLVSTILVVAIAFSSVFPTVAASKISKNDARRDIINAVEELNSVSPGSAELDAYIDDLMPGIIEDDMDYFEQIKACFDYVKDNTRYGGHYTTANMNTRLGSTTLGGIYRKYGEIEGFGAVALVNGVGLCNAYASAFIMMARKIGFDAYLVRGSTKGGGTYRYHEWAEIKINGTAYIFDPQLDQSLTRAGLAPYTVFCATYDQVPGRYIKK